MAKRITVDMDEGVLKTVDAQARFKRQSRNRVINSLVVAQLKQQERDRIDAEFESMADDEEYLALMRQVDAEWSSGSDEVMREIARKEVLDGVTYSPPR